ncbi:MAG: hypothetical protein N2442_07190 [Spirochaetes bacterium]|nr:hypothetical protein [Spirochaetota bacterium]
MIESAQLYTTVPIGDLLRARYSTHRLSLPLEQNLFMRFKHVTGVPSPDGTGFSVSKLQLLDTLIEALKRLQGKGLQLPDLSASSPERLDRLIEILSQEVHQKIVQVAQTPFAPALGGGESSLGILVNLRT